MSFPSTPQQPTPLASPTALTTPQPNQPPQSRFNKSHTETVETALKGYQDRNEKEITHSKPDFLWKIALRMNLLLATSDFPIKMNDVEVFMKEVELYFVEKGLTIEEFYTTKPHA